MRDNLRNDDLAERSPRAADREPTGLEREVPVPMARVIPEQVHAWLDGKATEFEARRAGGARDVEFWKQLEHELARQRRMRVPRDFTTRIMDALR